MRPHVQSRRCFLAAMALCLTAICTAPAPAQSLDTRVNTVIRSMDLGRASLGARFVDVSTGTELFSYNGSLPLIPASNMKLVTTAAALSALGDDFVFSTQMRLHERTLILRGDGDPAFGDPNILEAMGMSVDGLMASWVKAVKDSGVDSLDAIIVDDRVFDAQWVHPAWPQDQLHKWYCAQVSGLNFNDNCLNIYAMPAAKGRSPTIVFEPEHPAIEVDNSAVTGSENAFWVSRRLGTNQIILRGEVKHALVEPVNVTVHDPAMFFAETLAKHLRIAGIRTARVARAEANEALPGGRLLAEVKTTLPTVIARCNRDSQNLFAEAMFKRVGHRVTGQPGSWANGAAAARMFLTQVLGTDAASVAIDDGSGMSRGNRISAYALTKLLSYMAKQPEFVAIYQGSLAAPGEDGTLESRFKGVKLHGAVRGKSGYISGVVALSGYMIYDDRAIAFSLLLNNYDKGVWRAKESMEKLIATVDEHIAKQAGVKLGG